MLHSYYSFAGGVGHNRCEDTIMNKKTLFDQATTDEFVFKMNKAASFTALDEFGILFPDGRINWSYLEDKGQVVIMGVLDIACQEEPIHHHYGGKLYNINVWWQKFKAKHMPRWFIRRFPVNEVTIVAVHKFPELDPPASVLGREFVHLRTVDMWRVQDKLDKEKEKDEQSS